MQALFQQTSYDAGGNLIMPRHGIRLALVLAWASAAIFFWLAVLESRQWHQEHPGSGASSVPDPLWMVLLWIALPAVPLVLSEILLSLTSEEWIAAGAGIAAALTAGSFVYALVALLFVFFMNFFPNPYFKQQFLAVVVFLACSVWIVISAGRIAAKVRSGVFFVAGAVTLIGLGGGQYALSQMEIQLDREHELGKAQAAQQLFAPVVEAQHVLMSLAGCLILNESAHTGSGYPSTLDPAPADWPCDRKFAANAVREYSLTYSPVLDPATSHVSDFRLVATPQGVPVRGRYPLMVDSRGILFSALWEAPEQARAATSEARLSEIRQLQGSIQHYMDDKVLAAAPEQLTAEIVGTEYSSETPRLGEDGSALETRQYAFHYAGPRPERPSQFALSAQCQSYGQDCLRSYFLDYSGILHATGEPRAPTAQDPPAMDCEESDAACAGVIWPSF